MLIPHSSRSPGGFEGLKEGWSTGVGSSSPRLHSQRFVFWYTNIPESGISQNASLYIYTADVPGELNPSRSAHCCLVSIELEQEECIVSLEISIAFGSLWTALFSKDWHPQLEFWPFQWPYVSIPSSLDSALFWLHIPSSLGQGTLGQLGLDSSSPTYY